MAERNEASMANPAVPWAGSALPGCPKELYTVLDSLLSASSDSFYIYDREARLLYAGPVVSPNVTIPAKDVIGKTWRELGAPEDMASAVEAHVAEVFARGERLTSEATFETSIGPRRWVYTIVPLKGPDGRVEAVACSARDITTEREALEATRESENRFRALSEAAFEGIVIHDQGRVVLGNQAFADIFGYALEELIGRSVLELAAPQSRDQVLAAIKSGTEAPYEAWGLRKDGTIFPGELRSRLINYEGKPHRVTAARDITRSKQVENALRASEASWRALIDAATSIIMKIDADARITFINRVVPGYSVEDVVGRPVYDFMQTFPLDRAQAMIHAALHEGKSNVYDIEIHTPAGEARWFQCNLSPIDMGDGKREALIIATDVTDSRRATEEISRQRAELEKARELDRVKSNFVNAVTHELRTPLTSIMGYSEFLEDAIGGDLTETQREFVHQIQAGTRRLQNLVDDLLDFARLEAGTFKLRLQDTDLTDRVRAIANSLRPQIQDAGLALTLDLPEHAVCLPVDAQRIGQVLTNILINAIKFTDPGGMITLSVRLQGEHVRVEVQDTGYGIAADDLPKLFQRFVQLERGRRTGGGTGLGLSIAKALVEAHGGVIDVHSDVGQGSTFWFILPLRPPEPLPAPEEEWD